MKTSLRHFTIVAVAASLLSACDVKVDQPPGGDTTIVNPPGEKNTTIINPPAEKKTETTVTTTEKKTE